MLGGASAAVKAIPVVDMTLAGLGLIARSVVSIGETAQDNLLLVSSPLTNFLSGSRDGVAPTVVTDGSYANSSPAYVTNVAVNPEGEVLKSNAPGTFFALSDPSTTIEQTGGQNVVWGVPDNYANLRFIAPAIGPETFRSAFDTAPFVSPANAFTITDRMFIQGAEFTGADIEREKGSAILRIDVDGDGASDATVTLEGTYRLASFVTEAAPDGTYIRYLGNAEPIPDAESFDVAENGALAVAAATLLEGDTDPDGDALTLTGVSNPVNGTVSLDDKGDADVSNDEVIFTPTPGYSGAASFDYTVADGFGGEDLATVSVTVSRTASPSNVLNLAALPLSGFGGTQDKGTATVSDDGSSVRLENNAWKQLLRDVSVTQDTVLRFEFAANVEGEIHGIGFENDGQVTDEFVFQLHGTQNWGNRAYDDLYETGSGPQKYEIPVGQFFTGEFDRLVLVMDDDARVGADSTFGNISFADVPTPVATVTINGAPAPLSGFGGTQDKGTAMVSDDGSSVRLENNAWKQLLRDVAIEEDTLLRFSFAADVEGEIHGIGFENDGRVSDKFVFQLHGTQDWGLQAFDDLYATGSGPREYEIPVGQFFTGEFDRMVLVMDDDKGVGADSTFVDIAFATATRPVLDGIPASVSSFGGSQDKGTYKVSDDGSEIRLENNAWKQLLRDVTVEEDTLLRFSFAADVEGEIHGIGFENDGRVSDEFVFQLHGTQDWGLQAFDDLYATGSGPREYEIPVGQFFTGEFDRMVLVMDDDKGVGADSTFSDLVIG